MSHFSLLHGIVLAGMAAAVTYVLEVYRRRGR